MPEIYILNRNLQRIRYVEKYESFIWTIRRNEAGDCKLVVPLSEYRARYYRTGYYIERPESSRLMRIDRVEKDSSTGDVTITASSLEAFLKQRIVPPNYNDEDHWTFYGSVGWVATELVKRICIDGDYSANDVIQNLSIQEQDASTIQRRVVNEQGANLYDTVQALCAEDDLGFRIFFDRDTLGFVFRVYRGIDRSISQNDRPPVIFSADLDSLTNESFVKSDEDYKNVAYVKYKGGSTAIYDGTVFASMLRRVMYVDATDIEDPTPEKIEARALIELKKHNRTNLFDGEVQTNRSYTYNVDYEIGDLVTLKSVDDETRNVRVTEFVSVYDTEGIRYYPTFSTTEAETE